MADQAAQLLPESSPPLANTETSVREAEARLIRAGKGIVNHWLKIPPRFREKGLGNFVGFESEIAEAKAALEAGRSILIVGPCGSGKTHLACGLILEWFALRWVKATSRERTLLISSAVFTPWVELLLKLKDGFNEGYSELAMIKPYTDLDLMVIDDLGAERVSDWSREGCYVILDRRYRELKQTIITSNLDLDQISRTLDDRIASRLVEMGIVVKLKDDYRLKMAKTSARRREK